MKCRIQFKGNILLDDVTEAVSITELKQLAKQKLVEKKFLFSDFRYNFYDNEVKKDE
jgi:hypothetical protein